MASQRRRHQHHNRLRYIVPAISAISGSLLLLFALLSFLAPYPVENNHLQHRRHHSSFNVGVDDTIRASAFNVPTDGGRSDYDLWSSRNSKYFYGCSNASSKFANAEAITHSNRYLAIATSGGLNQQRTGITDAVVAARILNATLVVPKLDQKSFWKDSSNFAEIFNVDWFVSYLSNDVKIIKQLPRRGGKTITPYTMRVPRKCSERCYQNRVLPVLNKKHLTPIASSEHEFGNSITADSITVNLNEGAVQLTKFDYRLANKLSTELQKLRCRVNYHALKFTDPILEMGNKLVQRMRMRSKHYIALHLRFEPDMLAFSGCDYGGGEKEKKELGAIRRRWKTLHITNPDKERRHGKCPLTPKEVGLMLRAFGYGSDVHIYVASGEVYRGEETLAPLKALFPNFYSKDTLASKEELEAFSGYSSRMAALDFIVCDESDVFVTNNNGNMARILAGRRRYFGHKPTIRPNAKKLYRLFLNQCNMTWEEFASKVRTYQRGFIGQPNEVRPGRGEFHENPSSCICEDVEAQAKRNSGHRKYGKGYNATSKDIEEATDDQNGDDDLDWSDPDDEEDQNGLLEEKGVNNLTGLDYGFTPDEPELEEMLSD